MKRHINRLYVLMGLLVIAPCVSADTDAERETLALLAHEIHVLEDRALDAEAQAPSEQRVRFRYDWLRADLRKMRNSIQDHIDAPAEPHPVTPMRGDYRR